MPSRSAKLMPGPYSTIIDGVLNKYFPANFELDLNGRTLPWEAACLIPFCDEKLFLETETELLKSVVFSDHETERNTINFTYYSFRYNPSKTNVLPLNSTLTNLGGLE
jgi:5'-3' exoribonuclease 4